MSTIGFDTEEEKYLHNRDLGKIEGKGTTQSVGCYFDENNPWTVTDWTRFQDTLKAGYSRYFAAIFTNQNYGSTPRD